jgi:hypothetical protein
MKVNIYDTENVQKGRMMLINLAEDLKDDCKVTVSPQKEEKKVQADGEKKPKTVEEMKEAALKSKVSREEFVAIKEEDEDFEYDDDVENQPQYLFMELKSTASFKDVDID